MALTSCVLEHAIASSNLGCNSYEAAISKETCEVDECSRRPVTVRSAFGQSGIGVMANTAMSTSLPSYARTGKLNSSSFDERLVQ